jgi:hypothetical protein
MIATPKLPDLTQRATRPNSRYFWLALGFKVLLILCGGGGEEVGGYGQDFDFIFQIFV